MTVQRIYQTFSWAMFLAIVIIFVSPCKVPGVEGTSSSSRNLVQNSAFQEGIPRWKLEGWKLWGSFKQEKSGGPDNSAFVSIANPHKEMSMRQLDLQLDPAKTYTLSAYLKSAGWSKHRSGVSIINDGWSWESPLLKPETSDSDWKRYSATFKPGPSDNGIYHIVFYALPPLKGKLFVSKIQLEEGNKVTQYVETRPDSRTTVVDTAKAILTFTTPAVSPDVVTLLNFAEVNGFQTPKTGWKLIVDLPRGVQVLAVATQNSKRSFDKEQITRNSQEYLRYTVHLHRCSRYQGALQLYLKTTLPVGKTVQGYYHLVWNDGKQEEESFNLDIIRISPARVPRKFLNIMSIYDGGAANWPDLAKSLKHLGFNGAEISANLNEERLKPVVADFRKEGLFICNGRWNDFFPLACGLTKTAPEDAWTLGLDGERLKKLPCPSYKINPPEEVLAYYRKAMQKGISWFNYDEEMSYQDKGCFCERCKSQFKQYLARKAPHVTHVDPVEIYRQAQWNTEIYKLWLQFRADLVTGWYENIRRLLQQEFEKFPAESFQSAPETGLLLSNYINPSRKHQDFLNTGHDLAAESKYFNYFQPMIYTGFTGGTPVIASVGTGNALREVPKDYKIFPAGDAGDAWGLWWKCGPTGEPDIYTKYYLLETVASGAKGHFICKWVGCSGWDFKYLAETISAVAPLENMILAAQPEEVEKLKAYKKTNVHAIRAGEEMLICVSNYPGKYGQPWGKDVAQIALPLKGSTFKAKDIMTGEQLPLSDGKLTVSLEKEMCRLIYIGGQ